MNKFKKNSGEISFGAEIIIFIIILFFVWLMFSNKNSNTIDKPFIKDTVLIGN